MDFYKKKLFSESLKDILLEDIYGNKAVVYHRTRTENLIDGIYTRGFKSGGTNLYGKGFYSTYELESQLDEEKDMWQYGDIIVKFMINSINRFLFLDYDEFLKSPINKKIKTSEDMFIIDQLKYFNFKKINENKILELQKTAKYTSEIAIYIYKNMRPISTLIDGIIFIGKHDGKVLVAYNTDLIIPLSYSDDEGVSWNKANKNLDYLKKVFFQNTDISKSKILSWHIKNYPNEVKKSASINSLYKINLIKNLNDSEDNNSYGNSEDSVFYIEWEDGIWLDGTWENGSWENGTWKNGSWESGIWKNGTWEKGTWNDGSWLKGIWKEGTLKGGIWYDGNWENGTLLNCWWRNGIWENGDWLYGTWEKGTWKNGTWENGEWQDGTWEKGIWKTGEWNEGTWLDGTWENGEWRNGIWEKGDWLGGAWWDGAWHNGTWHDGTWERGIWHDGTWLKGKWEYGTWEKGDWQDGTWEKGDWQDGTWEDGKWLDGDWLGGTWRYGIWYKGTWHKGTWEGGDWRGGDWKDGEWKRGVWFNGSWFGGTWKTGEWRSGKWLGGTWLGGYDIRGNYHPKDDSPDKWSK